MPFRVFATGEVLTAANVNTYLAQQAISVVTSGTRPGSPVEGMTIYETDTDELMVYNGSGWVLAADPPASSMARKTADETVNNSSALQNDDELFVNVRANAYYDLELHLIQNSGATPGFKLDFTTPAGTSWGAGWFICGSAAANLQFGVMATAGILGITGVAADSNVIAKAKILTAGTAGAVQLRWAQSTANASNTIVRAASSLVLRRLS